MLQNCFTIRSPGGLARLDENGEFVATEPGIICRAGATGHAGDGLKFARGVPEQIIDLLELVEVEAKHR